MRIKLSSYEDPEHGKKVKYWKKTMLQLWSEFGAAPGTELKNKEFRAWLDKNWGLRLKIRWKRTTHWIETIKYGNNRISYVHAIEMPVENLSLFLLKFPTDIFNIKEERYDS